MEFLENISKQINDYTDKTGRKIMFVAIETESDTTIRTMTLQRCADHVSGLGMIASLERLLNNEKAHIFEYLEKGGEKHEERNAHISSKKSDLLSTLPEVVSLVKEFKDLKQEGDKIKETDPVRLVDIMMRMSEISKILKKYDKDIDESLKNKKDDDSLNNFLDKFKDTF
jgi:DNA repair ATPase RecN